MALASFILVVFFFVFFWGGGGGGRGGAYYMRFFFLFLLLLLLFFISTLFCLDSPELAIFFLQMSKNEPSHRHKQSLLFCS